MAGSERAAVEKSAASDAIRRREIAALLETVLGREPQHAIAPRIGIGLEAERFASRAVNANHVFDVALHLGRAFGLRHATGAEHHQYDERECTHGCLLSKAWKSEPVFFPLRITVAPCERRRRRRTRACPAGRCRSTIRPKHRTGTVRPGRATRSAPRPLRFRERTGRRRAHPRA